MTTVTPDGANGLVENLMARIDELKADIARLSEGMRPLNNLRREIAELRALTSSAPRAVAIDDGLILTKLAFDEVLITVDRRDRLIGPHIIMNGIYEKGLTAYFRREVGEISVYVDVGANIGYYTCFFGKHLRSRGNVFAFEPDPRNFEILNRNMQINWIDKKNIVIERLALADHDGVATLYQNVQKAGNTSLIAPTEQEKSMLEYVPYEVKMTSLDKYFEGKDIKIDLIKIDVEGFEMPVLKGARGVIDANPKLKIVLEWDPARWSRIGVKAADVIEFFGSVGMQASNLSSKGDLTAVTMEQLAVIPYANIVCERAG